MRAFDSSQAREAHERIAGDDKNKQTGRVAFGEFFLRRAFSSLASFEESIDALHV